MAGSSASNDLPRRILWGVLISGSVATWSLLFVLWVGPGDVFDKFFSVGSVEAAQLGAFGDSFGLITSAFSGFAVYLIYLAYSAQRDELAHIKRHFDLERRRHSVTGLVDRLDRQLLTVVSGSRSGQGLLDWINEQLDIPVVGHVAAYQVTHAQRWERIFDDANQFPAVEPMQLIVNSLTAVAEVASRSEDAQEKRDLASLVRSVLRTEDVLPLMYACAVLCRSDSSALSNLGALFSNLGLRPKLVRRLPLEAVPVSSVNTLDDTHFVD